MNKTAIYISTLVFILISAAFYWLAIRPEQIRASCFNNSQRETRPEENTFMWADGKQWLPKPNTGEGVMSKNYVWIYPDQDTETNIGEKARLEREKDFQSRYYSCLFSHGINP